MNIKNRQSNKQGPVARSMVSVNQRLIPWQPIGFDTAWPMVKANHALRNSAQVFFSLEFVNLLLQMEAEPVKNASSLL